MATASAEAASETDKASAAPKTNEEATADAPPTPHPYDHVCVASVQRVMRVFGGKWDFAVLEQLHVGTMRFGEILRAVGASTKSLTECLRRLEAAGIVRREAKATVPVTVEYSLTEKGRSFDAVLLAIKDWGQEWL